MKFLSALKLPHMATPANPESSHGLIYPKTDGSWYTKDSAGLEKKIAQPSAGNASDLSTNLKAQVNVTGGGTVTWNGQRLKWDTRFIIISNGRGSHFSTVGYYDIAMPGIGDSITGAGGAATTTVDANGIALGGWSALYYVLPIGSNQGSSSAYFRVMTYGADTVVPDHWVLLAVVNGDTDGTVKLGDGRYVWADKPSTMKNPYSQYARMFEQAEFGKSSTATSYTNAGLTVSNATGYPAVAFHMPGVDAPQLRYQRWAGLFEFVDNTGTVHKSLAALALYEGAVRVFSTNNKPALDGNHTTGVIPDLQLPPRLRNNGGSGVTDWNNVFESGWFHGVDAANAPGSGWWLGTAEVHYGGVDNRWVTQTVHQFTSDHGGNTLVYRRSCNAGTPPVWQPWYRVYMGEAELDARYAQQTALNLKANDADVVKLSGTQNVAGVKKLSSPLQFDQQASVPGAPASGDNQIYFKPDGQPYFMGVDGVERAFRDVKIAMHLNPSWDEWTSGKPDNWHSYWRDTASIPGTWTQDFTDKVVGVSSMKIDTPVGGNGRVLTSVFAVIPGTIVSFPVWAKGTGAGNTLSVGMVSGDTALHADFYQTGSIYTSSGANPLMTSTWTKYNFSFRVPADHFFARVDLLPYTYVPSTAITTWLDESFSDYTVTGGATGVEIGTLNMWPLATPPNGYLLCNGQTPLIADYPALAALLGTTFGGNGTTTFGVPDMRGRFPIGAGTFAGLNANEGLAESGRTPSHKHTMAHTHVIPDHQHALAPSTASNTAATGSSARVTSIPSTTGLIQGATPSTGGSSAANTGNQPNTGADAIPFLGINFIIKT